MQGWLVTNNNKRPRDIAFPTLHRAAVAPSRIHALGAKQRWMEGHGCAYCICMSDPHRPFSTYHIACANITAPALMVFSPGPTEAAGWGKTGTTQYAVSSLSIQQINIGTHQLPQLIVLRIKVVIVRSIITDHGAEVIKAVAPNYQVLSLSPAAVRRDFLIHRVNPRDQEPCRNALQTRCLMSLDFLPYLAFSGGLRRRTVCAFFFAFFFAALFSSNCCRPVTSQEVARDYIISAYPSPVPAVLGYFRQSYNAKPGLSLSVHQ
jgi:hypothetical protein